jgi:hypothetical protein
MLRIRFVDNDADVPPVLWPPVDPRWLSVNGHHGISVFLVPNNNYIEIYQDEGDPWYPPAPVGELWVFSPVGRGWSGPTSGLIPNG